MPTLKLKPRTCAVCGKKFPPVRKNLTCSERCRYKRWQGQMAALNAKRKAAPLTPIPCAICGVEFMPKRAGHKYHSPQCAAVGLARAVAAQNKRRKTLRK